MEHHEFTAWVERASKLFWDQYHHHMVVEGKTTGTLAQAVVAKTANGLDMTWHVEVERAVLDF